MECLVERKEQKMCGRYTLTSPIDVLVEEFGLSGPLPELRPSYNVAPGQGVAAVLDEGDGRRLELLKWVLVPFWAKDPAIGSHMINSPPRSCPFSSLIPPAPCRTTR